MKNRAHSIVLFTLVTLLTLSFANRVSAGEPRSAEDLAITSKVEKILTKDGQLRISNMIVDTYKREVTITGSVPSQSDLDRASQLARSVDGVKQLHNDLTIEKR
jgi:osmotically-inducible protein OsmY